jgi:hypothetical protein
MNPIAVLIESSDINFCGYCCDKMHDDAEWIVLTKPAGDGSGNLSTIFCSLVCFYRFCKKMLETVSAAVDEAAVH